VFGKEKTEEGWLKGKAAGEGRREREEDSPD
jgi:hypothetical protein